MLELTELSGAGRKAKFEAKANDPILGNHARRILAARETDSAFMTMIAQVSRLHHERMTLATVL